MELVAGAGNTQKLYYAYLYGADAVYIGLEHFSLRAKADNFNGDDIIKVRNIKNHFGRKLYCALNIMFSDSEIDEFIDKIDYFKEFPIDAFIVQDLGMIDILQKYFPKAKLHLSTQSSCVNSRAAAMYKRLGFSRVVVGRESSLDDIKRIKDSGLFVEAFCHGAMCIAYSGRCLMSAYMTGRSAQKGLCTHSCRWDYDVYLREHERDELFPVVTSDNFTQVLSSKDLCMVEHLSDMKAAGVDAIKIEGRMKSLYYTALVTQGYKKALDLLENKITAQDARQFISEIYNTSHREFSTGFYYNKDDANKVTRGITTSPYIFCATVDNTFMAEPFNIKNNSFNNSSNNVNNSNDANNGDDNFNNRDNCTGLSDYSGTPIYNNNIGDSGDVPIYNNDSNNKVNKVNKVGSNENNIIDTNNKTAICNSDFNSHCSAAENSDNIVNYNSNTGGCGDATIYDNNTPYTFHYPIIAYNMLKTTSDIEVIAPNKPPLKIPSGEYALYSPDCEKMDWVCDSHPCILYCKEPLDEGAIIRRRTLDPLDNKH